MNAALSGTSPAELDEDALKQYVADELARVRDRSVGLTPGILDQD